MGKKSLYNLTDIELQKAYDFVIYELNDATKCNDLDGIKFYQYHKKLVVKVIKDRNLHWILEGSN
jgi:hypothetical protein